MCGIAGIARIDGAELDPGVDATLESFAELLAHRGPDARKVLRAGPVGLSFTRLSLVGPSNGDQPLVSEDDSLVLIANGEVYNHRELSAGLGVTPRTDSDCEVLLHLYQRHGLDFLDQVRGMFGMILWDRRNGQLVLARDRFGIKPLYYHRDRTRIVLASEMKALFADPGTPRRFAWERAVTTPLLPAATYLTDTPPVTWFEGIESVPAGTILRIDLRDGSTHEHRYWEFPGERVDLGSADEFVDRYREILAESVADCATADTELGLFLSGGIDSGAVAALAAERVPDLHTFTVLNAGTHLAGDAHSARELAGKLGLPNHQVLFDADRVPSPQEWKRLLWLVESPFCGPEIYYKYELHRYAKQVRPDLRAMLLGAASDEFNGGYSYSVAESGDWADFDRNVRTMARTGLLRRRPDLAPWWLPGQQPLFTDEVLSRYAGADVGDHYARYLRWQYAKLQQYNLWHEDRTAAGSGIEARVPFLDHRLIELSASVPAGLREKLLWDKRILRQAMRGIVPDELAARPKGPFFYGEGTRHTYRVFLRMLLAGDGALVEEALAAPDAAELLDGAALRRTIRDLADSASDSAAVEIALRVVNLGLLAGMVADLPLPTARVPVGPPPVEVRDTGDEHGVARAVGLVPELADTTVPGLVDGVLLLRSEHEAGTWYLAVDGEIEYVLDGSEPDPLSLLRVIDGRGTLAELARGLGWPPERLHAPLADLVSKHLVTLTSPTRAREADDRTHQS
jgi:asparagine synthase (glutamine-hydrolysing)